MHSRKRVPDPTDAEIAAACEQIRNKWTAREKYRRGVSMPEGGAAPQIDEEPAHPWYPPVVSTDFLSSALKYAS
jgi:hypothetical protein